MLLVPCATCQRHGVVVTERVPTAVHLSAANARYLLAKRDHTGHDLALPGAA